MKKRIGSIVLALALLLTCIPLSALTAAADEAEEAAVPETVVTAEEAEEEETEEVVLEEDQTEPEAPAAEPAEEVPAVVTAPEDDDPDAAAAEGPAAVEEEEPEEVEEAEEDEALLDDDPETWAIDFDFWDGDRTIYDNEEEKTVRLTVTAPEDLTEGEDYGIFLQLGIGDSESNWNDWPLIFAADDAYVVNGTTITLNVPRIFAEAAYGDHFNMAAAILREEYGTTTVEASAWSRVELRETPEYGTWYQGVRAREIQMLPGDWRDVISDGWVWVVDEDHPEGTDRHFVVTEAEIVEEHPEEGGSTVVNGPWPDEGGDTRWWYEAVSPGTAKILMHTMIDGADTEPYEGSFELNVRVAEDTYEVWVDSEDGGEFYLPGQTSVLVAGAAHHVRGQEGSLEGLSYRWTVDDSSRGCMTLEPVEGHPEKATATFSLPVWKDDQSVTAWVELVDGGGNMLAKEGWVMEVRRAFTDLYPLRIDSQLDVGAEIPALVEVRRYPAADPESGIEYDVLDNMPDVVPAGVRYRWYYDANAVQVFDPDGNIVGNEDENGQYIGSTGFGDSRMFSIRRLGGWETEISLNAEWTDENGHPQNAWRNYRLDRKDYHVWFEGETDRLYSDGEETFRLRVDGFADMADKEIVLEIGQDGRDAWEILFEEGKEYDYDEDTGEITLYGYEILESGADEFTLYAEVRLGEQVLCRGSRHCEFREAQIDYHPEQDREMLKGWDAWIDREYDGRADTAGSPDEDFRYPVTGVEVLEGEGTVIRLEPQVENDELKGWRYEAVGYGDAVIKVNYDDFYGHPANYTFNVHVMTDVYRVDMWTADGSDRTLPGGTIRLTAQAWRDSDHDDSTDGVTYEWRLCEDNDPERFASLVSEGDTAEVTLTAPEYWDPSDPDDHFWERCRVEVIAYDGIDEGTGERIERARNDMWLHVGDDYLEIWPSEFNGELDLGQSEVLTAELRHYRAGQDDYTVENARFRWYYDPNLVELKDAEGNVIGNNDGEGHYIDSDTAPGTGAVTVTRRGDWDGRIEVKADLPDDPARPNFSEWHERERREYWLNRRNYDLWFEDRDIQVYDDWKGTAVLNTQELGTLAGDVAFEVEGWRFDEERDEDVPMGLLSEEDYVIEEKDGAIELTVEGSLMEERGWDRVEIHAVLNYTVPGDDQDPDRMRDAWCNLHFQDSCASHGREHWWLEGVYMEPTVEKEGLLIQVCWPCMEVRKIAIPKLIDVNTAEVTGIADQTYAGKKFTPAPTLTIGDETLVKGVDYSVTYGANTNAGKGTVTIVGIGLYGGERTETFTIAKATPALTVKAAAGSVAVGKTVKVTASGAKGTLSFKSSSTGVATVTSAGVVTGKKIGTVKITATSAATSNFNAVSKTVTVKVVPVATTKLTAVNVSNGIKLTWAKVSGATGYKVYRGSTLAATIKSGSTVAWTDTKATGNTTKYVYKVVAYASTGDSTLSKSVTTYFVTRPAISSAASAASKQITVKWGKNAKATGYQIQYSTTSGFTSGNKTVTVTGAATVSKVLTGLTARKTYYVRVRAYKTVGSTKYYSEWSAAKKAVSK